MRYAAAEAYELIRSAARCNYPFALVQYKFAGQLIEGARLRYGGDGEAHRRAASGAVIVIICDGLFNAMGLMRLAAQTPR